MPHQLQGLQTTVKPHDQQACIVLAAIAVHYPSEPGSTRLRSQTKTLVVSSSLRTDTCSCA